MKLSNIISVDKKFQTSVNLEYDINSIEKITGYIPTEQSVAVIERFLRGIYYPSEAKHSNILVGPYGRGKSHLLLILSAIMSLDIVADDKKKAKKTLKDLSRKISRVNEQTGALVESILNSNTRLLPVVINSNGVDINQSLILGLKDALERAGISDIMPTTHFDAAINIFMMWKNEYPEAISVFTKELKKCKIDVFTFEANLRKYDIDAYNIFCNLYPKVAAGTKFNPYASTDIVKLYSAVNYALKETTHFKGMFIIFDEFSKFIEANLDKSRMGNFKIIQDLAERADRENAPQMHFTCVTHKSLLDYSSSDSFKTVSGRFEDINFVASSEQSYELIANAILKKSEFEEFKEKYKAQFRELVNVSSIGIFADIEDALEKKLVYGFFPLAPVTAYTLLRVSEKVGQNERTVFTFLAQDEEGTLVNFVKEAEDFSLMTVEVVFDYFQELFKKSIFNEQVHSMWAKADSALFQVEEKISRKIIKALAIIGIVGDERFRPVSTHIKAALNLNDSEFEKAITLLEEKNIIAQRETSEYVLLTANGVDIQNSVNEFVSSKLIKVDRCKYLDDLIETKYLIPRQYNDEYSMIRYFKVQFIEAEALVKIKNWNQLFDGVGADGLVLNVLFDKKVHFNELISRIQGYDNQEQIIFCIPAIEDDFNDLAIKQLYAVEELKKTDVARADKHYLEELEVYEEDAKKRLLRYINELYGAESPNSHFYNCAGELVEIRNQLGLNKAVSKICSEKYNKAPKINNEMINKNNLSAPIRKAREFVVNHIFENSDKAVIPIIDGYGPEVSVFNSVFVVTGLNRTLVVEDLGLRDVLTEIEEFIKTAEARKRNISALVERLTSAPYGVRRGVIPMLIAYVLRAYKENIIIYYGKNEVELSAALLSSIVDANGKDYQILLENGTQLKDDIIDELLTLFSAFADNQGRSINKVYNAVKYMQNWMRSLPEYTKRCDKVYDGNSVVLLTEKEIAFRKELLKFEINSREFLYDYIFSNGAKTECEKCLTWIKNLKEKFDSHIANIKKIILNESKMVFESNKGGSLSSAILTWKEKLNDKTVKHMFDTKTNQVLGYLLSVSNYDDGKIIDDLSKIVSDVNIADWSNATLEKYIQSFREIIIAINSFNSSSDEVNAENGIEVLINGETISKTFSSVKTTPMGMTVLNNIEAVFEEYGEAISSDEKLNILLQIIKDLIN